MNAAVAIATLDRFLADGGEVVTVRRGPTDINVRTAVRPLGALELRTGANGVQLNHRAVLSPTGLAALLPLRVTDKLVRGGQERAIGMVSPKAIGSAVVRITLDFAG